MFIELLSFKFYQKLQIHKDLNLLELVQYMQQFYVEAIILFPQIILFLQRVIIWHLQPTVRICFSTLTYYNKIIVFNLLLSLNLLQKACLTLRIFSIINQDFITSFFSVIIALRLNYYDLLYICLLLMRLLNEQLKLFSFIINFVGVRLFFF